MSREDYFRALDTASFFYLGYGSTSGDASDLLDEAIHSPAGGYGVNNYGGYSNPEVDRLIEASDTCFSQERRLGLIQRTMELVCRDAAMVPLFVEDQLSAASAGVAWEPRLDMMVLGKEIRPVK
jgi:peptide/nickel transport system substrate-binding protein